MPIRLSGRQSKNEEFGPPYAVLNLSKIGLKYFRLFINAKASHGLRQKLVQETTNHPNIGWIFIGRGWFNTGIGVWAHDNNEVNDLGIALRRLLSRGDKLIHQSELTSLYGFGNQPVEKKRIKPMTIVDSSSSSRQLTHMELDYIKLITLDDSLKYAEVAELLATTPKAIEQMRTRLEAEGIVVGRQRRVNYKGHYYKVFIDTSSARYIGADDDLVEMIWNDPACIYFERASDKYNLEFELILRRKRDIKKYLRNFSDHRVAILEKNLYTNLYPLSKVSNMLEIKKLLFPQKEQDVVDLRQSKLWYLNHQAAKAYLDIYSNKKYFEVMEKPELELLDDVAKVLLSEDKGHKFHIVDIGSGNGLKGKYLIDKLGPANVRTYYPVDAQLIELATARIAHQDSSYGVHTTMLDFEKLSARFPLKSLPKEVQIYMLLGGTYGNFASSEINKYLRVLLNDKTSRLFITMPIHSRMLDQAELVDMYTNKELENLAFGPLAQAGFRKKDFAVNQNNKELRVQISIENKRLVSWFELIRPKTVLGNSFKKGTKFKMTTSWKPTLEEFKEALEPDFDIKQVFENGKMAIAELSVKK